MPKYIQRLTNIKPAAILADFVDYEGDPEGYGLIWQSSNEGSLLEWNIARAIANQLSDDLLIRVYESSDPDCEWELDVCVAVDSHIEEENRLAFAAGFEERRWLLDERQIAERINLEAIVRESIRRARDAQHV